MKFNDWFLELQCVAREKYEFSDESLDSMNPENWEEYYSIDLTPKEALDTDLGLMDELGGMSEAFTD